MKERLAKTIGLMAIVSFAITPVFAQGNVQKAVEFNNIGVKQAAAGDYAAAIESFKEAIQLRSNYAIANYNLGWVLDQLKQHESAILAFKRAIEQNPTYAEAYNQLGVAYLEVGQVEKAVEALREAIRLKPSSVALYNLGCIYVRLKKNKDAVEVLERAKQLNGDNAKIRINLSYAYTQQNQLHKAIAEMQRAVSIDPSSEDAQYFLGILYVVFKDKRSALVQHEKLSSMDQTLAQKLFRSIHREKIVSVLDIQDLVEPSTNK